MPQVCLSLQKILGGGGDGYTPCKYRIRGHERKQVNDTYVTNFLCHAVDNTLLFFPVWVTPSSCPEASRIQSLEWFQQNSQEKGNLKNEFEVASGYALRDKSFTIFLFWGLKIEQVLKKKKEITIEAVEQNFLNVNFRRLFTCC